MRIFDIPTMVLFVEGKGTWIAHEDTEYSYVYIELFQCSNQYIFRSLCAFEIVCGMKDFLFRIISIDSIFQQYLSI